jgi:hypothetical protein
MIFCSWVTRGLRPAEGRVAVPTQGENRAPTFGSLSETNNECQINFELLHMMIARRRARAIRAFRIVDRLAIARFTFAETPINESLVHSLATGVLLAEQRNAVLVGRTGSGKSHRP